MKDRWDDVIRSFLVGVICGSIITSLIIALILILCL